MLGQCTRVLGFEYSVICSIVATEHMSGEVWYVEKQHRYYYKVYSDIEPVFDVLRVVHGVGQVKR